MKQNFSTPHGTEWSITFTNILSKNTTLSRTRRAILNNGQELNNYTKQVDHINRLIQEEMSYDINYLEEVLGQRHNAPSLERPVSEDSRLETSKA
jgi:hypothetical protein